jgi:hypothetical protein
MVGCNTRTLEPYELATWLNLDANYGTSRNRHAARLGTSSRSKRFIV